MDRRKFLISLGAVAAAAVMPTVAATVAQPVSINKHKEALRLFDLCVAVASDEARVNPRFDALLDFMFTHFDRPELTPENYAEANKVLMSKYTIREMRQIPPVVADAIYPVMLTKMALSGYNMALDPTKIKSFDEFHTRYGRLVIDSING